MKVDTPHLDMYAPSVDRQIRVGAVLAPAMASVKVAAFTTYYSMLLGVVERIVMHNTLRVGAKRS